MSEKLNLYECEELIRLIETKAEMNDGELSDDDLQTIVQTRTSSIEQLGKLVNYIKYLDGISLLAKTEIERLQARKKTAENRIEGIKKWLLPYIQEHGAVTVGVHRISLRKSQGVVLTEGFENPEYGEFIETFKPDKKLIKESIQHGIEVQGAVLEDRNHVQIR
jgi:hypothetical protein